jgi:hypothetical protein
MAKQRELQDNVENVFDKMQDAYRAISEQRRKLMSTIKTRRKEFPPTDSEEAVNLAKADNDNFKLLDNLIEKQIKLIQIHAKLVAPKVKSESGDNTASEAMLTDDALKQLREMAKEEYMKEIHYDLSQDDE